MRKRELDRVLEQIAKADRTTVEEVRREMIAAMKDAQACTDPVTQARWARIPRKGKELTLEEFVEYLVWETGSNM